MTFEALLEKFLVPALLMILAAALGVGGREWIARARSVTKRIQAEDGAQVSVLAEVRAEKVQAVLREAALRGEIDRLTVKLAEAEKRLTVVAMLSAADPSAPVEVTLQSGFLDLERPLRPRPAPRAPARSTDVFQAADPFAPPVKPSLRPANPGELRMLDLTDEVPASQIPPRNRR